MNTTEDRLRAAFAAKAGQLTEAKLDELAARHEAGVEDLHDLDRGEHTVVLEPIDFETHRVRRRWVAPALAAAAVAVVAVGVAAAVGTSKHANPPAIQPTRPSGSIPAPSSSPTAPPSASRTQAVAPYLSSGQTGSLKDVAWSLVGAGWRLLQPAETGNTGRSLFLYDPADGRYLISDQLAADTKLVGWSPDGRHAALQLPDELDQIDLHTGQISPIVSGQNFITYTRPHGLAVLVSSDSGLQRYGTDGTHQLSYPNNINGVGKLGGQPNSMFYLADGSAFVTMGASEAILLSNSGAPLRSYNVPAGRTDCHPIRPWNSSAFLEWCIDDQDRSGLYLQPYAVSGAAVALYDLTEQSLINAWPLSNGDILLANSGHDCAETGYQILHPDGSLSPLRLPPGVPALGYILNMSGDVATFTLAPDACSSDQYGTLDYNMVTGVTTALTDTATPIVNYPTE